MKRVVSFVIAVVAVASIANAQELHRYTMDNFFQGISLAPSGPGFDYAKDGRPLYEYNIVSIPAGAIKVKLMYSLASEDGKTMYIIVTDFNRKVELRDASGTQVRDAGIRLTFNCSSSDRTTCRERLDAILAKGRDIQSTGVNDNLGVLRNEIPQGEVKFTFYVNEGGVDR